MKFSIAATFTAVVGLAAAAPQGLRLSIGGGRPGVQCLNQDSAKTLVDGFAGLLTAYKAENADALLADDFTDTSSSINALIGADTNAVTFPSKDAFKAGQGSQPAIPFTVIKIDTVSCDTISFRWSTTVTPVGATVKGANTLVASQKDGKWQIKTVYSEFNAYTWAKNIGKI